MNRQEEHPPRDKAARATAPVATRGSAARRALTASPWSLSAAKRVFDCICVLYASPVLLPLMLVVALAVRLTSKGPVLFLQERIGRHGQPFTILKFRTMVQADDKAHRPVTTSDSQRFTLIGAFLRRWKLDELPQLVNVLLGQMSLVGPRPKIRGHVNIDLPYRPGITGMASSVFAVEETVFARLPKDRLDAYYRCVVLPAKRQLDTEYMAQATFISDLRLLVNSVLRRWDTAVLEELIIAASYEIEASDRFSAAFELEPSDRLSAAEELSEIAAAPEIKGMPLIDALSVVGLATAVACVLLAVVKMGMSDWHYNFLLLPLGAGAWLLAHRAVAAVAWQKQALEARVIELKDRVLGKYAS